MHFIFGGIGILFILYFLCIVFFVGHGTNFYIIWLIMGIVSVMISICLKKEILFQILPGWVKKTGLIMLAACGIIFIIAESCIISGFFAKGKENLDYIIVLGAQMKVNGPSKVLKMRLDKACDYLEDNPDTYVIVSGGQGKDEHISEAQGMYDYLIEKGVGPERIIKEDKSENTSQNINFSSNYLNKVADKTGIVTNNFHIFRAVQIAKKSGYKYVCGIAAPSEPFLQFNNMFREFFGVMKDCLTGNM